MGEALDFVAPAAIEAQPPTIEITHRKIAGLDPSWAVFRGTSILLRPIGGEPAREGMEGTVGLYRRLAALVQGTNATALRACGYCPLPPESYHMTLSDLIHDGNVARVLPDARPAFGTEPGIAPGMEYPSPLERLVADSGILALHGRTVRFTLDTLSIRTGSALVAEMRVVDETGPDHAALIQARARLDALLDTRFGIESPPFRPHVTLGYFANKNLAGEAKSVVRKLRRRLEEAVAGAAFGFGDPAPFRFADMAAFCLA